MLLMALTFVWTRLLQSKFCQFKLSECTDLVVSCFLALSCSTVAVGLNPEAETPLFVPWSGSKTWRSVVATQTVDQCFGTEELFECNYPGSRFRGESRN